MISSTVQRLAATTGLLKSRASKYAVYGVLIAVTCIFMATVMVAYLEKNTITLDSLVYAQKTNFALWVLDMMPFMFAFWGQYVSSMIAYQAGAVIIDETSDLRAQTAVLEEKATHEATHDSLTELPNRVLLHDRLQQALSAAQRQQSQLAVLIMDLDNFKEINDTLGHFNGDIILKQVATRLQGTIRNLDSVARLGGDEFAILLPKLASERDLPLVVKKLQQALKPSFQVSGLNLDVHASIGIALFPEHGNDVDTLMQRAEVAMYAAKREKSGILQYSRKLDHYSPRRLTLLAELRQAIEQQELLLFYQPKVDLKTNKILEVEALARWQHPEHGLMPPDDFIPLAERTGLIRPLTNMVIDQSLKQVAAWQAAGYDLGVTINISARVLLDPQFPDMLIGMMAAHRINPDHIVLEITETTIMVDHERAMEVLTRLQNIVVRLSIDDFGTGYSSLAYLKQLPVHELKIDKSFVMNMADNHDDAVIVKIIIELGHHLGLKVTAEGVETDTVLEQLKELTCDVAQGFLISRPLPADELMASLPSSSWKLKGAWL
ncbi:MAG: EAL domain-containing protein [Deltaproteobacteria bacterium]|nr:EAL domain-containing protein [Candidatus Anaeroferrophillus wilburensis]MBN2887791.1 EAL domain-containing protein [Deltaproteobacteria bacterium]